MKVSPVVSHIVTRFNYTPLYKKAYIAMTKEVEKGYGNWEKSYNELPQYLITLQKYVLGTVAVMDTLPTYTQDGTYVNGNRMFHRLS